MWPFGRSAPPPAPAPAAVPSKPKRGMRINEMALHRVQPQGEEGATPYTIPKPPPGVVPVGSDMAMDRDISGVFEYAQAGDFAEGLVFLGYPYLAELAQRPEYRRISEIIAKEMTRKWVTLQAGGNKAKNDKIATINRAMVRFKVQPLFRRAAEHDGQFGKGQIFIDTGHASDPEELQTPLLIDPAKIAKGGLKRFAIIDPLWTYPADYNASNPLAANFYRPAAWFVQGTKIDTSRFLTFVGREMPDILKPAYMFGGLSLSQMAKPYIDNWLRTRQNVSDLIEAFSIMVLKTNMSAESEGGTAGFLAGGSGAVEIGRVELFNRFRSNRGTFVIDKDTEDFANVSAQLGTLDKLQAQAQEHIASVVGIPLVKLLGISPAGLNASSDGEIRAFYDWIHAQQEHIFAENLTKVLDLIQLNEFGEIDPEISFRFEPLWQMTEAERATIRKTNADTAAVYMTEGVLLPEEERKRLAEEDEGLYDGLDLSVEIAPPEPDETDDGESLLPKPDEPLKAALSGA